MERFKNLLTSLIALAIVIVVLVLARGFVLWDLEWWPGAWGWAFRCLIALAVLSVVWGELDDD